MKYFTFYRESNNFDDILNDAKKVAKLQIKWGNHLMLGVNQSKNESACSILLLKYGDDMVNGLTKDFTPKPNVDYIAKQNKIRLI